MRIVFVFTKNKIKDKNNREYFPIKYYGFFPLSSALLIQLMAVSYNSPLYLCVLIFYVFFDIVIKNNINLKTEFLIRNKNMDTLSVLARFEKELRSRSDDEVSKSDRALCLLLHSDVVYSAIKTYITSQEDHFLTDKSGYHFHKSFREWSVIEDVQLAGAVWVLIGDSELFWKTIKIMTREERDDSLVIINVSDE